VRFWMQAAKNAHRTRFRALVRFCVCSNLRRGILADVCSPLRNIGRSSNGKLHGATGFFHDAELSDTRHCGETPYERARY
jgi:hypothetical protein